MKASCRKVSIKNKRTGWRLQLVMAAIPALAILKLPEARAESESGKIVAVDLLTVKETEAEAEPRLRVIRFAEADATASLVWA